jgi:hypothetical protein
VCWIGVALLGTGGRPDRGATGVRWVGAERRRRQIPVVDAVGVEIHYVGIHFVGAEIGIDDVGDRAVSDRAVGAEINGHAAIRTRTGIDDRAVDTAGYKARASVIGFGGGGGRLRVGLSVRSVLTRVVVSGTVGDSVVVDRALANGVVAVRVVTAVCLVAVPTGLAAVADPAQQHIDQRIGAALLQGTGVARMGHRCDGGEHPVDRCGIQRRQRGAEEADAVQVRADRDVPVGQRPVDPFVLLIGFDAGHELVQPPAE